MGQLVALWFVSIVVVMFVLQSPGPSSLIGFPASFGDIPAPPPIAVPVETHVSTPLAPVWIGTDLERISPRITGPRTSKPHLRGLLTIPIGKKSASLVNDTIHNFLDTNSGRIMLFAYDSFDWSSQSWYSDERIILVRHLKQMKWWFVKRFVTPLTVEAYDYIWLSDDDAQFSWNPNEYMDLVDKFHVELSQPSHSGVSPCSPSPWAVTHQRSPQNGGGDNGRWVDFVECGPLLVVHRELWKRCLWNFVQDDLSSGWGLDEMWYHACNRPKTAVLDKLPMCHRAGRAASSSSIDVYDPARELPVYKQRFPHIEKAAKTTLGTF